ncbi:hypothetical protein ACFE04_020842 [Oxalis oulophora]
MEASMTPIELEMDDLFHQVDNLEERVKEIEEFYFDFNRKHLDKDKPVPSIRKQQQDVFRRDAAAAKIMHDLMRNFGTILRQITQHKFAWPFMHPVDVKGLKLDDYYEIIERPMDFSTIKNQMEAAKDGTGYKNVRDICADVRLIFINAMKYNDENSDVYDMAKTLSEKFEDKWLQFLPKVMEEEKRREKEEAEAKLDMQLAQEVAHAKMARDLRNELCEVVTRLEDLREMIVQKCRKLSVEEKRLLGVAISRLHHEDLAKALEIVAQYNPNFDPKNEVVELDINAQNESTLWRLKFFVKDTLGVQGKGTPDIAGNDKNNNGKKNNKRKKPSSRGAGSGQAVFPLPIPTKNTFISSLPIPNPQMGI